MRSSNIQVRGFDEDRTRRLEEELWQARRNIIALMPDHVEHLLLGYHGCRSRSDYYRWQRDVIDQIVMNAKPDLDASYFQGRGYCPLCKGGSLGPYDRGFTLPEGLKRHLEGFGNTHICSVTQAAFQLAQDVLRDAFHEAEEAERLREAERRRTERLYLTDPSYAPKLFEEGLFASEPRNQEALAVAENRLQKLGFNREERDNIISYKFTQDPFTILADLRASGRIDFVVFHGKKSKGKPKIARFYILDNWKNDIVGKFESRLSDATNSLFNKAKL